MAYLPRGGLSRSKLDGLKAFRAENLEEIFLSHAFALKASIKTSKVVYIGTIKSQNINLASL